MRDGKRFVIDQVVDRLIIARFWKQGLCFSDGSRRQRFGVNEGAGNGFDGLLVPGLDHFFQLNDPFVLARVDGHDRHPQFTLQCRNIDLYPFFSGQIHHGQRDHDRNTQVNQLRSEQ